MQIYVYPVCDVNEKNHQRLEMSNSVNSIMYRNDYKDGLLTRSKWNKKTFVFQSTILVDTPLLV